VKLQKITTEACKAKGLKQILEECRFNIEKMKAKMFPCLYL
jgi:hypothetical protein